MIRTFKLQNANGQTYDLTPAENFNTGVFLDPAGLGVTYNNNLYQIGNRFAVINRKRLAKNISGKLLFPMPESYANYEKFARFIDKTPLKLLYNPAKEETNEYEFEVEIQELTKTEIEEGGLLCNLKFNALTLPRKVIFIDAEQIIISKNSKKYNYKYNYRYSDGATNTITLDVDVSEPSPIELIIRGYTENPEWKHYVNGQLIATGKVNATILDGNSLVVSSELPKMQILQKDNLGNVVNDLYQNSVWDTDRFLFLRRGENVITVSDKSSRVLNISLKGFLEYATI